MLCRRPKYSRNMEKKSRYCVLDWVKTVTKVVKKFPLTFVNRLPYNDGTKWLKVVESGGFIHW